MEIVETSWTRQIQCMKHKRKREEPQQSPDVGDEKTIKSKETKKAEWRGELDQSKFNPKPLKESSKKDFLIQI